MSINEELKFTLNVDVNLDAAEKAVEDFKKRVGGTPFDPLRSVTASHPGSTPSWSNRVYDPTNSLSESQSFGALQKQIGAEYDKINIKPSEVFKGLKGDSLKSLTEEMEKQVKLLEEARELQNPEYLKERAIIEAQISELIAQREKTEKETSKRIEDEKKKFEAPGAKAERENKEAAEMFKSGGFSGMFAGMLAGGGEDGNKLSGMIGKMTGGGQGGGKPEDGSGLTMAGEMIGEMVGGPVGAEIGKMIAEKIPETVAAPAKMAVDSLKEVGDSLNALKGPLGPVGLGFDMVGDAMKGVGDQVKKIPIIGDIVGGLVDQLTMIPGVLKGITETLTQFAGMASPAVVQQLDLVNKDVMATIGQTFVPMVEMMVTVGRTIGDVFANILPSSSEMASSFSGVRDMLNQTAETVKGFMAELGPILREGFLIASDVVAFFVNGIVWAFKLLLDITKPLITWVRELLGIQASEARTSVGASAQQTHMTNFAAYQQQLQLAAFALPGTVSQNDTPRLVSRIADLVKDIADFMGKLTLENLEKVLMDVAAFATDPARVAEAVGNGARSFNDWGEERLEAHRRWLRGQS